MPPPGPRQTKKQKKALAFRTRQKTGKNKDLGDEDALDFPIDENQDLAGLAGLPLEAEEVPASGRSGDRKGKAQNGTQYQAQPGDSKKRKREVEDVPEEKPQKKSKVQPTVLESGTRSCGGQKTAEAKKVQPQRFILFIGKYYSFVAPRVTFIRDYCRQFEVFYNQGCYSLSFFLMRYCTLRAWFPCHRSCARLEPPPTVRLPAPKAAQPSSKSKGYAFLEFTDKSALQQALRLHHSELEGRKINVELTAGGGGKSEHRVRKLQERNKGLHEQRVPRPHVLSLVRY